MAKILTQIEANNIGNIRLFAGDAAELVAWAPAQSLARIDLIHPDPWPKRRHWKRRFVQDATVAAMARVLEPDGEFRFVCDIDGYVAWTLAHLLRSPDFAWLAERADDWRLPWPGYTMTRYGRKAEREGRRGGVFEISPDLILRSIARRCVSKDGSRQYARWFETREDALLTMRELGRVATPSPPRSRLSRVGCFPHHALAALAAQKLDRVVIVDVSELSLVDAVAA